MQTGEAPPCPCQATPRRDGPLSTSWGSSGVSRVMGRRVEASALEERSIRQFIEAEATGCCTRQSYDNALDMEVIEHMCFFLQDELQLTHWSLVEDPLYICI